MNETSAPRQRRKNLGIAATLTLIVAVLTFWFQSSPDTYRSNWPAEFSSEGERLYFTGRSTSGIQMQPKGGNHHTMMMGGGGCVGCHGTDRSGGRLWPAFWQVAPPLTAGALTGALTGDHEHDGHDHETYTAGTLALAITRGIRPDGSKLSEDMPRWAMPEADLAALAEFLLSH